MFIVQPKTSFQGVEIMAYVVSSQAAFGVTDLTLAIYDTTVAPPVRKAQWNQQLHDPSVNSVGSLYLGLAAEVAESGQYQITASKGSTIIAQSTFTYQAV